MISDVDQAKENHELREAIRSLRAAIKRYGNDDAMMAEINVAIRVLVQAVQQAAQQEIERTREQLRLAMMRAKAAERERDALRQEIETRFSELITTELDHYAQKIAKRVLRKALSLPAPPETS